MKLKSRRASEITPVSVLCLRGWQQLLGSLRQNRVCLDRDALFRPRCSGQVEIFLEVRQARPKLLSSGFQQKLFELDQPCTQAGAAFTSQSLSRRASCLPAQS